LVLPNGRGKCIDQQVVTLIPLGEVSHLFDIFLREINLTVFVLPAEVTCTNDPSFFVPACLDLIHLDILVLGLLASHSGIFIFVFDVNAALGYFLVVHHIYVSAIHILQGALVGIYTDTHRLVDSSNLDTITWPDEVN